MARRKRKQTIKIDALLPVVVVVGGLVLAVNLVSQISLSSMEGFALLGALFFGAFVIIRRRSEMHLTRKIGEAMSADVGVLVGRRAQLLLDDAYGTPQPARWHKEVRQFFESKVIPHLTRSEKALLNKKSDKWTRLVDDRVCAATDHDPAFGEYHPEMSGSEFETFCAEELKRIGWDARVTKQSGDQGVDIVAQKNGLKLVLQCKRYNQPVGNAAVQEIATAKTHERAHFGAVVSNNRYTVPAQQLAKTSRIALLHFSDLKRIDAIILDRV